MVWIAAGFPIVRAYAPSVQHARMQAEKVAQQRTRLLKLTVSEATRESLRFVDRLFSKWDRTCPILEDFGPTAGPQRTGWVDAATTDKPGEAAGCGGILWYEGCTEVLGFSHAWTAEEVAVAHRECEQRESTGSLECFGILHWLQAFGPHCERLRVLLLTDNESAMLAFCRAFSARKSMMPPIRKARIIQADMFINLRVRQVHALARCKIVHPHFVE